MAEQEVIQMVQSAESQDWMPVMHIDQAVARYHAILRFTKTLMQAGKDYGVIPGTDKPTLLKPGAEKLASFFGLTPRFEAITEIEDWTGEQHGGEPLFYYRYRCSLYRGTRLIAESEASANSRESKYRYRWVSEAQVPAHFPKESLIVKDGTRKATEFLFSYEKRETGGRYGKPEEYWRQFDAAIANKTARMVKKKSGKGEEYDAWEITYGEKLYRVPNPDIFDQLNTLQKMGQKRALIAVVLIACNASEYYTQDLEDLHEIDFAYSDGQPAATGVVSDHVEKVEKQPTQQQTQPADPLQPILQPLFDRCHKQSEFLDVLAEFKADFKELTGETVEYTAVLHRNGLLTAPAVRALDVPGRHALVRDLYKSREATRELLPPRGSMAADSIADNSEADLVLADDGEVS